MLEDQQGHRNRLLAEKANVSGANDPHQITHDANERLIAGAGDLAAAQKLGISEEELLQLQSRRNRRMSDEANWIGENATLSQKLNSTGFNTEGELQGFADVTRNEVGFRASDDVIGRDQSNFQEFANSAEKSRAERDGRVRYDERGSYKRGDYVPPSERITKGGKDWVGESWKNLDFLGGRYADAPIQEEKVKREGAKKRFVFEQSGEEPIRPAVELTPEKKIALRRGRIPQSSGSTNYDDYDSMEKSYEKFGYTPYGADQEGLSPQFAYPDKSDPSVLVPRGHYVAAPNKNTGRVIRDRTARESVLELSGTGAISAEKDALARLQNALATGAIPEERIAEAQALAAKLELTTSQRAQVGAEKAETRALVSADNSSEVQQLREIAIARKEAGNPMSKTEALGVLKELRSRRATRRQEIEASVAREAEQGKYMNVEGRRNLDKIGQIGANGNIAAEIENRELLAAASSLKNRETAYVDPRTGSPISVRANSPEIEAFDYGTRMGEINAPDTSQMQNAPQSVREFVGEHLYDRYDAQGLASETFPTVNISQTLGDLTDRFRKAGISAETSIRSGAELQSMADRYIAHKGKLTTFDPATRRRAPIKSPTLHDVMASLRMSSGDEKAVARALFQTEAARASGFDDANKKAYFTTSKPRVDGRKFGVSGPEDVSDPVMSPESNESYNRNRRSSGAGMKVEYGSQDLDADYRGVELARLGANAKVRGDNVTIEAALRRIDPAASQRAELARATSDEEAAAIRVRQQLDNEAAPISSWVNDAKVPLVGKVKGESRGSVPGGNPDLSGNIYQGMSPSQVRYHNEQKGYAPSVADAQIANAARVRKRMAEDSMVKKVMAEVTPSAPARNRSDEEFFNSRAVTDKSRTRLSIGPNSARTADNEPIPDVTMIGNGKRFPTMPDPWLSTEKQVKVNPSVQSPVAQLALPYGISSDGPVQGPKRAPERAAAVNSINNSSTLGLRLGNVRNRAGRNLSQFGNMISNNRDVVGYGSLAAGAGVLAGIMGRRGPAEVNEEEYGG